MARKTIELYNLDKYDAYIPTPKVDKIEGDADEIILSADAYEESASGGIEGSLTINASGGVWTDTGPMCVCEDSIEVTTGATDDESTTHELLTFPKSKFRNVNVDITINKQNKFTTRRLTIIHNGAVAAVHAHTSVSVPTTNVFNDMYSMILSGTNFILNVTGIPSSSKMSCIVRSTLI